MIYGKGMLGDELYFRIFEERAAIPHSSGNCREICDWCESFAHEHRLRSLRDLHDNIIIFKEGTPGRENEVPLILQGHLDMVFERDDIPDAPHENEPIRLRLDGDFVTAYHTTLGGDDGIAVAYSLAILASSDISHPPG